MNRENAILLNKLVDISQGKWSSVHGPSTNKQLKKRNAASVGPRSLNISVRRKENERIERENHAFAKRLYSNTGSISKKQLESDYRSIMNYKKNITRVKKNRPSYNGRFQHLPPLSMRRAASTDDLQEGNAESTAAKDKDPRSVGQTPIHDKSTAEDQN